MKMDKREMRDPRENKSSPAIPETPRADWPSADQAALNRTSRASAGPFAKKHAEKKGHRDCSAWKENTWRNVEKGYGKWLAFLAATHPEAVDEAPAARITGARCEGYAAALAASGLAVSSQGFHLYQLAMAARVVAPRTDWQWLTEAGLALRHAAVPVREKRSRIVPIADLYDLGIRMMNDVDPTTTTRQQLLRYRDGLILALWAARPWRVENYASLDIERHISLTAEAGFVSFDRDEMKTEAARDWTLPDELVPYIRTFIDSVRHKLPGARQHSGLWPSGHGGCLTKDGLATVLERHTKQAFGVAVHPHAVRYSAATSAAISGPDSAKLVMAVLGHSNPRVSLEYYMLARTLDASRKMNAALADLRGRLR